MDLLIIVSNPEAGAILEPLARALGRTNTHWAIFLTNDGVKVLSDPAIVEALGTAQHKIACHDSWERFGEGCYCPVNLGSQTNNSEFVGKAARIVSL